MDIAQLLDDSKGKDTYEQAQDVDIGRAVERHSSYYFSFYKIVVSYSIFFYETLYFYRGIFFIVFILGY